MQFIHSLLRPCTRWLLPLALIATACAQDKAAELNALVQDYAGRNQFMGSVLLAQNGQVVLSQGYGFANLEEKIPNTPTTKFRLGSLTKQFTAACILLLEERGKLKVSDPVKTHLPDAPASWDGVTLFHLLTHTSGIPNYTDSPDYRALQAVSTTPEKLVARFRDRPLEFAPGEKFKYSNSGYVLLGYLIERVSGQSYADFVRENVFAPLGMNDSGYDSASPAITQRAAGYTPGPNGPRPAAYIDMSGPFAAGGLYSTTEDLLRWEQALFGGKLLRPESFEKMTTANKGSYAMGISRVTIPGETTFRHSGAVNGFYTSMVYAPVDQLTVIVLANQEGNTPDAIVGKLAMIARGMKVPLLSDRKSVAVSPRILADYVGTYELNPTFSIVVTLEGDTLAAQGTGQPKIPLVAASETVFFPKALEAQVEFFRNEQGAVTHCVLDQNGRKTKAVRK